ncbi:hypothetical protein F7725_024225 [Dissostichus mawsoni]|uniref:Macro domain-containing protein n=1 Tax=Dissostichus mawsoni TaxID=36200 RepID=A0A7J5XYR3_DISMA|nr:hypothetical protein F7725_024225 [Dissostichus mawsoni]
MYEECNSLNGCETGKAKITCGYDLPAKLCTNALQEYSLIKTAAIEGCIT